MKYLKWAGGILVGLAILFIIVGLCLPRLYHVERSVTINAPPEKIHSVVNRLEEWPKWTAWTVEKYPDMKVTFSGPKEGVGANYEWDGESTGHGELELKTSDPATGVTYDMAFDHGAMPSTGGIKLAAEGTATKVTWFADGDLGWSPISRYFGLALDGMMGPDFQTGLENLKKRVEAAPSPQAEPVENKPAEDKSGNENPTVATPAEAKPSE